MPVSTTSAPVADFRFPRQHRLLKPEAFTRVFRDGVRSSDNLFTLLAAPNGGISARLGLAVSRKACAKATGRNRIKRQVRESFRRHAAAMPSIDIVVMAKREAAAADPSELRSSLENHWRKLAKRCAVS